MSLEEEEGVAMGGGGGGRGWPSQCERAVRKV